MRDHEYIESNEVIDRYVMGKLNSEESERFADHFMSCPECIEQLELAEAFQRDLKLVAAEEVGKVVKMGLLARLASARNMAVVALAAVLLVALPFVLKNTSSEMARFELESLTRANGKVGVEVNVEKHSKFIIQRDVVTNGNVFKMTLVDEAGKIVMTHIEPLLNLRAEVTLNSQAFPVGQYHCYLEISQDGEHFEKYGDYLFNLSR